MQAKSYYPLCDHLLKALKTGRSTGPKCVGWQADLGVSAKVSARVLCRKSYPHFRKNRYKTPCPFPTPTKKACVFNTSGICFLRLTPDFCNFLVSVRWSIFFLIGLTEYIAVAAMPLRLLPPFYIGVWDYPNKQNGHGLAGPVQAVFRECGHTP